MDTLPDPPHELHGIGRAAPAPRLPEPLQTAQEPDTRPVPVQAEQFSPPTFGLPASLPQPQSNHVTGASKAVTRAERLPGECAWSLLRLSAAEHELGRIDFRLILLAILPNVGRINLDSTYHEITCSYRLCQMNSSTRDPNEHKLLDRVRARLPMALSMDEVRRVLDSMTGIYRLMTQLMCGSDRYWREEGRVRGSSGVQQECQ